MSKKVEHTLFYLHYRVFSPALYYLGFTFLAFLHVIWPLFVGGVSK